MKLLILLLIAAVTLVYFAVQGSLNDWDRKPNLDVEQCMEHRTRMCELEYPTLYEEANHDQL